MAGHRFTTTKVQQSRKVEQRLLAPVALHEAAAAEILEHTPGYNENNEHGENDINDDDE